MKKIILPICVMLVLASTAFVSPREGTAVKEPAPPASLGEVVYAVPLRKEVPVEELQRDWHYEYLNPFANDSFFVPLLEKIRNKELDVRVPVYPFTEKMNRDSAAATLSVPFEALLENPETFEIDTVRGLEFKQPYEVVAVVFHEEWFYDARSLTLEKKVKGIIPLLDYGYFSNGDSYGQLVKPSVYIPFADGDVKRNDFTVRHVTYDFKPDSVRLADYPAEEKFVLRRTYAAPDAGAMHAKLVASLKAQVKVSSNPVCGGQYPHAQISDKKARQTIAAECEKADRLRFRESWFADFEQLHFRKTVEGVFLGMGSAPPTVYLPMNKTNFSFVPGGKVHIENYYAEACFKPTGSAHIPNMTTHDSLVIDGLAARIGTKIRSMEQPGYMTEEQWRYSDPLDKRRVPATTAQLENLYIDTDYVYVEDPIVGDLVEKYMAIDRGHNNYCGFGFMESWDFDPATMKFDKKVKNIGLLMRMWRNSDESEVAVPWLYYDNPYNPDDPVFQKSFIIASHVITPALLNWGEQNPEENSTGTRVAAYSNSFENNVENEARFQLVQQIIDLVRAGKLTAWSTGPLSPALTVPQFNAIIDSTAKASFVNPERGKEYSVFNEIRFDEDWYYNPWTGQLHKHVNSLTFVHRGYDFDAHRAFEDPAGTESRAFRIKVNGTK